jgi:hypothetical protein
LSVSARETRRHSALRFPENIDREGIDRLPGSKTLGMTSDAEQDQRRIKRDRAEGTDRRAEIAIVISVAAASVPTARNHDHACREQAERIAEVAVGKRSRFA